MGLLKKITKPFKKAAKKLVPKELAGIMQIAAPFTGPYAPLVYAAGAYKQSGKINPIALATMALPYVGVAQGAQGAQAGSFGIGNLRYGKFDPSVLGTTEGIKTARDFLGLRGAADDTLRGGIEDFLFGAGPTTEQMEVEGILDPSKTITADVAVPGTRGVFGAEGEFNLGQGKLLRKGKVGENKLNLKSIAAMAASGLSLATATKEIEEQAREEGASDSEIAALTAEAAEFWSTLSSDDFKVTPTLAQGGRVGFALGTRPTAQESGLGGLPIEADMRYTGGFMPYGAKEKADDVPARLSKNEFVFTADAVRAAGGGSVQKGAQRMYNTMKQLEAMGKA